MFFSHKRIEKHGILQPIYLRLGMTYGSLCIRFGTYVLIARTLGVRDFGAFLFLQWIATLFLPVLGIGMTPFANHALAELQQSEKFHSIAGIFYALWRLQCRRILLYGCIYIPVVSLFSIFMWRAIPPFLFLLAGLAALPLFLSSIVSTTLQGLQRFTVLALLRFGSTVLNVCLVLGAIALHRSLIEMFLLAPACTSIVVLACALVCVARRVSLKSIPEPGPLLRERMKKNMAPAWSLYLLDSTIWREFLFFVVILVYWRTLAVPGFYAFSVLLCIHLTEVIPGFFLLCLVPIISNYIPIQNRNAYDAFVRMSSMIALFAVALCLVLTLCSTQLVVLCFGSDFQPLVTPLRILLVAVVFGSAASVSLTYLTSYERKQELLRLSAVTTLLYIVLGVPCTLLWGIVGTAIACTTAQVVTSIGTIVLCRKFLLRYT